ncbi:unnamed protein product [Albugo candida]|uniref:Trichohyalin-plectin-homology domain-containing protein n=1 Tax=Albugo candida TaxID=65357 RepID=A0A024G7B2_9STRA|nr:unnamed protein product [Albugo candida]|eukprot:CCI42766.1 unnamed protein product [Albugo candida]
MANVTKVSYSNYQRIAGTISPSVPSDKETKRLELKQKSSDRYSQWPNTLDAMRQKKDRWKKDKEDREEKVRLRMDEEERQIQTRARTQQIERANELIYEQTDRMKTLRSKQLLTDVIYHRHLQEHEKRQLENQNEAIENAYASKLLKDVLESEKKDLEKKKINMNERIKLAKMQKEQLEEYKQRYIDTLIQEKREGERIVAKVNEELQREQEVENERKCRMKQASEETQSANAKLLALRQAEKEKEQVAELKREEDALKKQQQIARGEKMQRMKFEQKQARKQRMIDLATQNLVKLEQKNDERIQNQFNEVREKEEKGLQDRADRRAADLEAIHRSRQQQLDFKAKERMQERQEAKELMQDWEMYGQELEKQLREEKEEERSNHLRIAIKQKKQADARRKLLSEDEQVSLLNEKLSLQKIKINDARFREIATKSIEEAKQRGMENVYPLQKALVEDCIDLLPASGFRI